ncbi:hypothetical protein [Methylobacterium sp. Gmos1]
MPMRHGVRETIARRSGATVEGTPVEVPEKRREIGRSTSEVSEGGRISTGMSVQVNPMFPAVVEEATRDPSSGVGTPSVAIPFSDLVGRVTSQSQRLRNCG